MAGAAAITGLLRAWSNGDEAALERLVPLVERELQRLARSYMAHERRDHTLQPTALVNEAFVQLHHARQIEWRDRAHFLGIAARLMRRVLIDHARRRAFQKRAAVGPPVSIDDIQLAAPALDLDLLALDHALNALNQIDRRKVQVVEMRYFGGMTIEETADALAVSVDTVKRDWQVAKLWLLRALESRS